MSHMKTIAKTLKVEMGERFYIKYRETGLVNVVTKFYFGEKGLFEDGDVTWKSHDKLLQMLIIGDAFIIKDCNLLEANIPIYMSEYWSYDSSKNVCSYIWYNNFNDNCRFKLGIVFPTKELAIQYRGSKINEIMEEKSKCLKSF